MRADTAASVEVREQIHKGGHGNGRVGATRERYQRSQFLCGCVNPAVEQRLQLQPRVPVDPLHACKVPGVDFFRLLAKVVQPATRDCIVHLTLVGLYVPLLEITISCLPVRVSGRCN